MNSLADDLPSEVADQIHPDWRKNESDYWVDRDNLLSQYRNQWIAYAKGAVIASGTSAVEVFRIAQDSGQHPFVTCVGREHESSRMRRASTFFLTGTTMSANYKQIFPAMNGFLEEMFY